MAVNHLNPPTGNMADNVVGFARAFVGVGNRTQLEESP